MTNTQSIEYTPGQAVTFEGRPSLVVSVERRGGIVTVSNYAGQFMVGRTHPELVPA